MQLVNIMRMSDILYDPGCQNAHTISVTTLCDAIPGLPDNYIPGMQVVMCGVNLQYRDLRGADLSRKNLSRSCFIGANLSGANLSGACLYMTDLTNATLTGAITTGADFTGARVCGVVF